MIAQGAWRGAAAGVAGVAAMTLAEKVEQSMTNRPNSYVPARTLLRLVGRRPSESAQPLMVNHIMHWGTGIALGALRGVWAVSGLRGIRWSVAHAGVRLATDQTLENATRVGAPPATWPAVERWIDVLHKTIYSLVTGMVADRVIASRRPNPSGGISH